MEQGLKNFLILYLTRGVGSKFLKDFYRTVGGFEGDLKTLLDLYFEKKNIPDRKRVKLTREVLEEKEERLRIIERLITNGVEIVPFYHPRFPVSVSLTGVDIAVLFCKGNCDNLYGFSIVGTRGASLEGKLKAREFASKLAMEGITVVSGGANGVDKAAHRGALKVGGKTGVILGEGIFSFLKRENRFAEEVLKEEGYILSQFPPTLLPAKWTFPQRNALIAALGTLGTLVVEAPIKSGALITARYAHKMGRRVYAYVGCTNNPTFAGNVKLLEEGLATLVTTPERLLQNLSTSSKGKENTAKVSSIDTNRPGRREEKETQSVVEDTHLKRGTEEKETSSALEDTPVKTATEKILEVLTRGAKTFDELLALTSLPEEELNQLLLELELEEKVIQEGGFYRKI